MRSRIVAGTTVAPSPFSGSGGTLAGGGGGGAASRFWRIHLPRSTGDVLLGLELTVRMLPWPSSPRRCSSANATRRNCRPVTFGMP